MIKVKIQLKDCIFENCFFNITHENLIYNFLTDNVIGIIFCLIDYSYRNSPYFDFKCCVFDITFNININLSSIIYQNETHNYQEPNIFINNYIKLNSPNQIVTFDGIFQNSIRRNIFHDNCILPYSISYFKPSNFELYDEIGENFVGFDDVFNQKCKFPTLFFTFSDPFSMSDIFHKTSLFTNSHFFTYSNSFSESQNFTNSNDFTISNIFSKSDIFSNSDKFISTNKFSKSFYFSNSNQFSKSNEFIQTKVFSKSFYFSNSNHFSISDEFIQTKMFSKSFYFSNSNQFSESNEFTQTQKFSPSYHFSNSDYFDSIFVTHLIAPSQTPKKQKATISIIYSLTYLLQ